jgi:polar amino acid transport system substrate-binding protein
MKCKQLLAVLMLLCSPLSQAQPPEELLISVGDWPPYLSADLQHGGVIAHLISDLFADEGYQVNFQFLPWPRAYAAAAAGRFDATAVWMHKGEREADFLFSAPLLDEQFVFFHLKNQPFDWQEFTDLNGMRLGGGLEYSYGEAFDSFLSKGTVKMERSRATGRISRSCSRSAWPSTRKSSTSVTPHCANTSAPPMPRGSPIIPNRYWSISAT